ncbi:MAG: cytochrome oxidase Cu insertion factor (SCO1/SenC/PrrC family) [Kiritimatiellia bacterium]|jgi:cytochrome oxidase Cu insertion factor (SCO1/SenC/PrrC family)
MRGLGLLVLMFVGCASRSAKPPGEVWGVPATDSEVVPVFSAVNSDGQARDRDHLLGHPTVVWFFPVAGTPG